MPPVLHACQVFSWPCGRAGVSRLSSLHSPFSPSVFFTTGAFPVAVLRAGFAAAFSAGVRFLLARLFCNSAMKSTTLVVAFSGICASSSVGGVTTPLDLSRFSMTLRRRSRNSSR